MRKTKILSLVLALALAVSMLAGCGGGESGPVAENEGVLELEGALCSAEPLTLTAHIHFGTNVFEDDWYWNVEGAKATNITLHGTAASTSSDSNQEFNTMLVNQPLPDIIHGTSTQVREAGRDGALIPLNDLVEKYAPNIKAAFEQFPDALAGSLDTDGKLYYIPVIYDQEGPTMGWYTRQDWLDKLGLEAPTNKDEFYNMLKAFREQDPNGNGKKDEVPYMDRHKSVSNLLQLWDLPTGFYHVKDGKVYSPRMTETFKEAMKELQQWYAEGLIDQEIFSRQNVREELFGNNLGGALVDWFSSTMAFNLSMPERVPGFEIAVIEPPKNINGTQNNYNTRPILNGYGWGISKDNKYPAETMKYFDYWFSKEGNELRAFGIEGEDHYVDENGEKQYTEAVLSSEGGAPTYMRNKGNCEIGGWMNVDAEIKGMTKEAAEGFAMYVENGYQVPPMPSLVYTKEESRIVTEKSEAVNTFMSEYLQHWTMGSKDVDATWDEYISGLKSLGVEDLIRIQQDAYDRQTK